MSSLRQRILAYKALEQNPRMGGADLSRAIGIPTRSASRYVGEYHTGALLESIRPSLEDDVYAGSFTPVKTRVFTGAWKLEGDFWVINDIHIPATNWEFAQQALEIACAALEPPRKVIIAGDLICADALSRWDDIVPVIPLADEMVYATEYLDHLAQHFQEIYFFRGNHEDRVLKTLRGQINSEHFQRMLSDNSRVNFSMYSYATVKSGNEFWRITHQKGYSRNPLSVARKLASKLDMNVICAHQHHSAVGRSENNMYTCVDSGGLHDFRKMNYVMLDDNTSPVMNNGFVILRDGAATLYTPYSTMTDVKLLCQQ